MSAELLADAVDSMSLSETERATMVASEASATAPDKSDTSKSSLETSFQLPDGHSSSLLQSNSGANVGVTAVCLPETDGTEDKDHLHMLLQSATMQGGVAGVGGTGTGNAAPSAGGSGDTGSDSGVDIDTNAAATLQRALSSTSGGYASSGGGLDERNEFGHNQTAGSCNSSMISYSSEMGGEIRSTSTILRQHSANLDCTSEGGSESSSITGGPVHRKSSIVRKKVALIEPAMTPGSLKSARIKDDNAVARSRARTASANRTALQTTCRGAPVLLSKDRARSRDKVMSGSTVAAGTVSSTSKSCATSVSSALPPSSSRSTPLKRPITKQDSVQSTPRTPQIARTPSINRGGRLSAGLTPTHLSSAAGTSTGNDNDGRWPSVSAKCATPSKYPSAGASAIGTPEHLIIKTKVGPICLDTDKNFATLPRRRKEKSDDDLRAKAARSTSAQRTDRMTTSAVGLVKRQPKEVSVAACSSSSGRPSAVSTPSRRTTISGIRLPPHLVQSTPKTKIYHETCAQTALTADDIANALAGILTPAMRPVDAADMETRSCQVDIRDKELEALHEQLRNARTEVAALQGALNERGQQLLGAEQQLVRERDEKQAMRHELKSNTQRILGMLALVQRTECLQDAAAVPGDDCGTDSLLMLESQIQQSGHALEEKQCEIEKLYGFCRTLQTEMQRSMSVQRSLLEEKNELEKESTELQDFLQDEKTTLVDALREAEVDAERATALMAQREADIERLQEECRHLVRISEQRRHEYFGMQSKYNALEQRSKELIVQQGSAVSGASMALAGLGARLDQLVEQLISSYSISEQELEDVVYHNEAYTQESVASSVAATPDAPDRHFGDGSLSPQRHQSFIVAVISAIRNAASSTASKHPHALPHSHGMAANLKGREHRAQTTGISSIDELAGDESDSTEMLDSETEPCLMMENVLEDVSMPDTHSHNLVSSSIAVGPQLANPPVHLQLSDVACPSAAVAPPMGKDEESIHNLSQAIYMRQQIEQQANRLCGTGHPGSETHGSGCSSSSDDQHVVESLAEMPSMAASEYSCCAQPLVDQIISVDNLVTKLLKVLRIIQMDNDNCIQQLIGDKNELQLNKEELQLKLHDWEQLNAGLRSDLDTATCQLKSNSCDLVHSRAELQRHRAEIDRLNVDICNLSTLCQNTNNVASTQAAEQKQNVLHAIAQWQAESGDGKDCRGVEEPHVLAQLVVACQENPLLKQQLLSDLVKSGDLLLGNQGNKPTMYRNLQEAIVDTKRQYEAIDRALETLHGMQSTVQQSPALLNLQRDLEETNFLSASNIPIYTAILSAAADCNANGQPPKTNGSHNGTSGSVGSVATVAVSTGVATDATNSSTSSPGRALRIDSTA